MSDEIEKWYFTFGVGQTHPRTDQSLRNRHVVLKGSEDTTRLVMIDLFGKEWSMQYSEKRFIEYLSRYPSTELAYNEI